MNSENKSDDGIDIMFIYEWVDSAPLSRPKKNIARDFSDGVMLAEIIKHSIPSLVEIHNYPAAHSSSQKLYNWNTLNRIYIFNFTLNLEKVLKKLNLQLNKKEIEGVISCQQGAIENILKKVYEKINIYITKGPVDDWEITENKIRNNNPILSASQRKRVNSMGAGIGISSQPKSEIDYKNLILQKDKTIIDLKSTLEVNYCFK
jgi:hypothetical protein